MRDIILNGAKLSAETIEDIKNLQSEDCACIKELLEHIDFVNELLFMSNYENKLELTEQQYKNIKFSYYASKKILKNLMM